MGSWEAAGLRRHLGTDAPAGVDFVSNDYLGLARHPRLVAATTDAAERFGVGARAARLLGGGSPLDREVERLAAEWTGGEDALLFPTGYQANLGVVTALAGRGDVLLCDALLHASAIDAARLSGARREVFAHSDTRALEAALGAATGARRRIVLVEGVYGMDGDLAPLAEMARLCERYDASLIVDEAHGTGVLGPRGAGAVAGAIRAEEEGGDPESPRVLRERVVARVITGGKALGAAGGIVVGSTALRDHLLNRARSFVFTTGPAPTVSAALLAGIEIAASGEGEELRNRAREGARSLAAALGAPPPPAAIVPRVLGDSVRTMAAAEACRAAGLDVRGVRPPTVPEGTSRLRIVVHAFNTAGELDRLAGILRSECGDDTPTRPVPATARPRADPRAHPGRRGNGHGDRKRPS